MKKEEFIAILTTDIKPAPGYFGMNVKMNRDGHDDIHDVAKKSN